MADQTTYFSLVKPTEAESGDISVLNGNMDTIDTELHKRGTTVNGISPNENGNYVVNEIEFARQIVTDDAQQSSGEFIFRTTGGEASLSDGPAKLVAIYGRSAHTGIVDESLEMTVNAVTRGVDDPDPITATINRDTFVAYVNVSGTITLEYTNAWSANPTLYGVTVVGTPIEGDTIVIVYQKANRGTITNADPDKFISTGWNLYNHTLGYARVKKYSNEYGFMIGGSYTTVKFSSTLGGAKSTITPAAGYFSVPGDGYVWVTGGNAESTYILMTWSDWSEGYTGSFQQYTESVVDISDIMDNFPNGLLQVGSYADEINFSMLKAISRIDRIAYTSENIAAVIESGRAYDADENYIYVLRDNDVVYDITETGDYTASDHGLEIITGSTVEVFVQTLYGQNLVAKLRKEVVVKTEMDDAISGVIDSIPSKSFLRIRNLNANEDLNDIIDPGIYTCATSGVAQKLLNCPVSTYFIMVVLPGISTTYARQIVLPYNSVLDKSERYKVKSGWSDWVGLGSTYAVVALSFSGYSKNANAYRVGNWMHINTSIGGAAAFSSATGIDVIGTLPEGYRPNHSVYVPCTFRDAGAWATANYCPGVVSIDASGTITLRGNKTQINTMKYVSIDINIILPNV